MANFKIYNGMWIVVTKEFTTQGVTYQTIHEGTQLQLLCSYHMNSNKICFVGIHGFIYIADVVKYLIPLGENI